MPDIILATAIVATLTFFWACWFIATHPLNTITKFVAETVAQVFYGSIVVSIIFWVTFIFS